MKVKVICEGCSKKYVIDSGKIPKAATAIKCPNCKGKIALKDMNLNKSEQQTAEKTKASINSDKESKPQQSTTESSAPDANISKKVNDTAQKIGSETKATVSKISEKARTDQKILSAKKMAADKLDNVKSVGKKIVQDVNLDEKVSVASKFSSDTTKDAKSSMESDFKTGGIKQLVKGKYFIGLAAVLAVIFIGILVLSGGSEPPFINSQFKTNQGAGASGDIGTVKEFSEVIDNPTWREMGN